jgi:hypothetical protein
MNRKVQRKEWFNPRKSIGKKRDCSKEGRPRTAGIRLNRVPLAR